MGNASPDMIAFVVLSLADRPLVDEPDSYRRWQASIGEVDFMGVVTSARAEAPDSRTVMRRLVAARPCHLRARGE